MTMHPEFKTSLRAHLVELAQDAPRRERAARRRAAVGVLAGVSLLAAGGAIGWGLSHAEPPSRIMEDPTDFEVRQDHIGTASVTLPEYPGTLQVPATFTCHGTGTLTIAGWDERECAPGRDHIFVVELTAESAQMPVEASDPALRWTFSMTYDLDDVVPEQERTGDDSTAVLPGGDG